MKRHEKPITYPAYAESKLQRRGISKEQIEKVVRNPDAERPGNQPNRVVLTKALSARERVSVVIEELAATIVVVTAW